MRNFFSKYIIFALVISVLVSTITFTQNAEAVSTKRYSDYNLTDNGDGTSTRLMGLIPRLPDGAGNYTQDYYFYNNTNTYTIASGLGTYVYIVSSCGLKFYAPTQDTTGKPTLINSFTYTIRDSPSQDFSTYSVEKNLAGTCSAPSFFNDGKHLQINGTKQNGNVTFTLSYTLDAGKPMKLSYYIIPKITNHYWRITESQAAIPSIIKTYNSTFIANATTLINNVTKNYFINNLKNPSSASSEAVITYQDENGKLVSYNYQTSINVLVRAGLSFNATSGKASIFNDFQSPNTLAINDTFSIDPQIYVPTPLYHLVLSNIDTSGTCSVTGGAVQSGFSNAVYSGANNVPDNCNVFNLRFDTTWATNAIVTKTELVYGISSPTNAKNCDFVGIANDPATASTQQQYDDIRLSPTVYVTNDNSCTTTGAGKVIDLGASANTDLMNGAKAGWFAVGARHNPFNKGDASVHHQNLNGFGGQYLRVTYSLAFPPTAPQSFTATAGKNQVSLAWLAPNDNGGQAISKYYIARSTSNRLFQEPLPSNGGKDDFNANHPVNMTGNTLLLFFDDKNATTLTDASPFSGQNTIVTGNTIFDEDDYSTKGNLWTTVGTPITYNDVVNGFDDKGYFNAALDSSDRRIYRSLTITLPSSGFHLLLDFSIVGQTTADHYIMVLSNNTNNPDTTAKQNTILIAYTNGNLKECTSYNTSVKTCSGTIAASIGSTYFLELDRTSTTSTTFHVFIDKARKTEIAGSPVTLAIDSRITDLNTIQHSVRSSQGVGNSLTAWIDNLLIYTITPSHLDLYRQTGIFNQAILFDGTHDYVNITSTKIPVKNNNDFTLGFWLKQKGYNLYQTADTPLIVPLSFKKTSTSQTLFEVNASHAFISSDGIPIITAALITPIHPINENFSAQHGWTTSGTGTNMNGGVLNLVNGATGNTHKSLGYTLSSNDLWSINFAWFAGGASQDCFTVASLTAGGTGNTLGDAVDTIGITTSLSGNDLIILPYYKHGSTVKNLGVGVNILTKGVTYYITFQKESPTVVKLYAYTDPARTVLLGPPDSFIIPLTVTGFDSITGADEQNGACISWQNYIDDLKISYDLGAWHQFTFTRGGNIWKIFEDGTQIGTNVTSATNLGSPTNNGFIIGANGTGTGAFHAGYFDDYFIQNRTMTSNEINNIYFRGTGTYPVLFSTAGTSYTDTSLTNGQQYFYRIFANNSFLNGTYTTYKNATVFTIPSAPQSLTANRISTSQVNLSWTSPLSNGGTILGGYYIVRQNDTDQTYYEEPYNSKLGSYWKFDGNLNYTDSAPNKANLTLTIGTPNFTSSQIFQGFNYNGGYHTAPFESKYDYDYNTPFSISHWVKSNTAATMMIVAKGGTTGLDKDGFQDYIQSNGRPTFVLADPSGTHLIKVEYNFNVLNGKAQNIIWVYDGTGLASGVHIYINGTQQGLIVDSDNLASNSIQNNKQLTIAARDGGGSKFIGVIDDLRIFSTNLTTTYASVLASFTTSTSISYNDTIASMTSLGKYKVYAVNQVGTGPFSNIVSISNIPRNPESLTATAISGSQIRLDWSVPLGNGGLPIIGYKYQINGSGTTTIGNVTTFVVGGLAPLHTQTFRVLATNAQGDGAYSNNATATTRENMSVSAAMNYTIGANVIGLTPQLTVTSGIPFPNATKIELINGTTIVQTNIIHTTLPKGVTTFMQPSVFIVFNSTSNMYLNVTVTNGTHTVVLKTNSTGPVVPSFIPIYKKSNTGFTFNYTLNRNAGFNKMNLTVNIKPILFDIKCNYKVGTFDKGTWHNYSQTGFYKRSDIVSPTGTVYITCYDPDTFVFFAASYGDFNGTTIATNFASSFGSFFGLPVGSLMFIGIIFFAAIFTGRSAPTGIIMVSIAIGIEWYLGFFTINPLLWVFVVGATIMGALVGKKIF